MHLTYHKNWKSETATIRFSLDDVENLINAIDSGQMDFTFPVESSIVLHEKVPGPTPDADEPLQRAFDEKFCLTNEAAALRDDFTQAVTVAFGQALILRVCPADLLFILTESVRNAAENAIERERQRVSERVLTEAPDDDQL